MPVERARLGRTGIEVLRLGFGGIPIQSLSEDEAVAVVRYVLDQGMDFVDTAREYTNSEERIGKALVGREQRPIISSKSPVRSAEGMEEELQKDIGDPNAKIPIDKEGAKQLWVLNPREVKFFPLLLQAQARQPDIALEGDQVFRRRHGVT